MKLQSVSLPTFRSLSYGFRMLSFGNGMDTHLIRINCPLTPLTIGVSNIDPGVTSLSQYRLYFQYFSEYVQPLAFGWYVNAQTVVVEVVYKHFCHSCLSFLHGGANAEAPAWLFYAVYSMIPRPGEVNMGGSCMALYVMYLRVMAL